MANTRLASAASKPKALFPTPPQIETLENGLRVVYLSTPHSGVMAYYTLVRVGSRNEVEPGLSGFAHLFEHMMFRGTKTHTAEEYSQLVTGLGLEENAYTTDDYTAYYYTGPSSSLETVIEVEADRFQNLHYSKAAFQTEAKAVLGEYNKNFSNPTNQLIEDLQQTVFHRHTYRHTTMGFLADIQKMPERYEYSLKFFDRWYRPDNCTIFVVGDFPIDKVRGWIKKYYGPWKGKSQQLTVPAEPTQKGERRANVAWKTETQPRLAIAYPSPAIKSDNLDSVVQEVLGEYLFGETSPLYRRFVLEEQKVLGFEPLYQDHRDPWMFGVFALLKQKRDLVPVEKALTAAIEEVGDGNLDVSRFDDVRQHLRRTLLMSLETPQDVAEALVAATAPTDDVSALEKQIAHLEAVKITDLVNFANHYLLPERRNVITLSADKSK